MACQKTKKSCNCDFNIKSFGLCDPKRVSINGADRTVLNWSEISVPEILCIPEAKPDIENLDQIYATADLTSVKLIETPFAYEIVDRAATDAELGALTDIVTAITALDITGITTAIDALLLLIPPLSITPVIQGAIDTVNSAIDLVTTTLASLVAAVANAPEVGDVVLANVICTLLATVQELVAQLISALNALLQSVIALVTIVTNLLGLDLTLALAGVSAAITAVLDALDAIIASILNLLALLDPVSYLVISPNEEGTCLTGRKLVIQGFLNQKVVYTGEVETQSVHSAHYSVPFSAFIVVYAKFDGLDYISNTTINTIVDGVLTPTTISGVGLPCSDEVPDLVPDLCEEFCVEAYIEDVFATALDPRTIFKNVTLFFLAKPSAC